MKLSWGVLMAGGQGTDGGRFRLGFGSISIQRPLTLRHSESTGRRGIPTSRNDDVALRAAAAHGPCGSRGQEGGRSDRLTTYTR